MTGGKRPFGYTIVEVMIVLAVSGVTFLIAAVFVGGKQASTAFDQGVYEMASRLQDVADQVAAGQYSDIPFGCSVSVVGGGSVSQNKLTITAPGSGVTSTEGTNQHCTFIGKLVHFNAGGDSTKYEIFSLGGSVDAVDGSPATSLAEAAPTPIVSQDGTSVNLTLQSDTPDSLQIDGLHVTNPDGSTYSGAVYGIAYTQSLGATTSLAGQTSYTSGTQSVQLAYDPTLTQNGSNAITDSTGGANYQPAATASMCLTDGSRYAYIKFGSDGNPQNVVAQVLGAGETCS